MNMSSSKYISGAATTTIISSPAQLCGAVLTAAAAAATLVIYDSTLAASGNVLLTISVPASTTQWVNIDPNVMANSGIVAVTTGVGVQCNVYFCPGA